MRVRPAHPSALASAPSIKARVASGSATNRQLHHVMGHDLLKVIWHDGQGARLFTNRLERGRFIWPSAADGVVTIWTAQLGILLSSHEDDGGGLRLQRLSLNQRST
jgi:hypothetical protein